MRRILFLLTAATALCAGPYLPFPLARYKGVEVTNGGSVKGVVTIDPIPAVAEFEIEKDAKICGAKKPSFRLAVDPATKGVKNVVVYLYGIQQGRKRPKGQTFTIDQKDCLYVPHISIVPVRSKVLFKSSDPILHNVHVYRGTPDEPHAKTEDVLNVPFKDAEVAPMEIGKRALRRPGFFAIQCDAGHVWMSAYVWVVEHPYYVVTDDKGRFELKGIPPGTYTLRFWHAGWKATPLRSGDSISGYEYGAPLQHSVTVTIKPGEAAAAGWTISGS